MRTCEACGVRKWLDAFRKSRRGGYRLVCIECSRARHPAQQPTPKRPSSTKKPVSAGGGPLAWREVRLNGTTWLGGKLAQQYIDRRRTTLNDWRRRGTVMARQVATRGGRPEWVYHKGSLRQARRDAERRKREQVVIPGPGRGHKGSRSADELAKRRAAVERKRADREAERRAERARRRAAAEEAERIGDALYARQSE